MENFTTTRKDTDRPKQTINEDRFDFILDRYESEGHSYKEIPFSKFLKLSSNQNYKQNNIRGQSPDDENARFFGLAKSANTESEASQNIDCKGEEEENFAL